MIFTVSMKDPDTLNDAIEDAVKQSMTENGLDHVEQEALLEIRKEKIYSQCSKWFRYGEYLEVEIDTDAGTCVVVQQKD